MERANPTTPKFTMSDDVDKHVLKKYDIQQKLGKGAYGESRTRTQPTWLAR